MGAKLGQNNVKGEQTKVALLQAAEAVFAEAGYRGSSLASVAERAGVTQSGLLHHFRTKDELLAAVLEAHEASDDALLLKGISRGGIDVVDGLAQLITEYASNRIAVRLFAVLVAESTAPEHPGHEYMRRRYERLRERLVGALSAGIASGRIRADVPLASVATALIALMDGLQLQWIYDREVDMQAAFALVAEGIRTVIAPLRPPTGRSPEAAADALPVSW